MAFTPVAGQTRGVDTLTSPAPTAPPYSLLTVSRPLPPPEGDRVRSADGLPTNKGVRLNHVGPVVTFEWDNCPDHDEVDPKDLGENVTPLVFHPFTYYRSISCVGGGGDTDRLWDLAAADVRAAAAWEVSRQLQTGTVNAGTVTASPALNQVATVVGPSTALPLVEAVGVLEQAFHLVNRAGGDTVLHLPYLLLPEARRDNVANVAGSTLVGPANEAISVGPGYDPQEGPDGSTTAEQGEAWVYLTGPIYTAVGEVFEAGNPRNAPNPEGRHLARQNVSAVIAEQRAIFAYDHSIVFAVLVAAPDMADEA